MSKNNKAVPGEKEASKTEKDSSLSQSEKPKHSHLFQKTLIIIFIALIVTFILAAVAGLKFRFLINDELVIALNPGNAHFYVTNKEPVSLNISVLSNNFANCKAICNFSLRDLSRDLIISSKEEFMPRNKEVVRQVFIPPQGKGSGQALYQFGADCYNIRTTICLTDEDRKYSSSLITVDYSLNSEEIAVKEAFSQKVQDFTGQIAESGSIVQQNQDMLERIPDSIKEKQALVQKQDALEDELAGLEFSKDKIFFLWMNEEYLLLPDFFTNDLPERAALLSQNASQLQQDIILVMESRNKNIDLLGIVLASADNVD